MYGCDCEQKKARDVQLSQPFINFNGSKGWMGEEGCLIENDTNMRFDEMTNKKYINQLPTSIIPGYYGHGEYNVDGETQIREGLDSHVDRPCNVLSGSTTLNLSLTPMIDKLSKEVQDVIHIIPEDNMDSWIRGGLPSRQIARNREYLKRWESAQKSVCPKCGGSVDPLTGKCPVCDNQ